MVTPVRSHITVGVCCGFVERLAGLPLGVTRWSSWLHPETGGGVSVELLGFFMDWRQSDSREQSQWRFVTLERCV